MSLSGVPLITMFECLKVEDDKRGNLIRYVHLTYHISALPWFLHFLSPLWSVIPRSVLKVANVLAKGLLYQLFIKLTTTKHLLEQFYFVQLCVALIFPKHY